MKILQLIKEEILPLSRRQNTVLLVIIACVFQFILFYAPALAEQAVKTAEAQTMVEEIEEIMISNETIVKETSIDDEVAKLIEIENTKVELATTTAETEIASAEIASTTPRAEEKVIRTSTHTMTAYNSEVAQTDDTPCITANGFNVCEHGIEDTIAANFLPMGTKVRIPDLFGDRIFIVRDRMNARYPDRVDIWMKHRTDAIKFGVKVAKIEVLE